MNDGSCMMYSRQMTQHAQMMQMQAAMVQRHGQPSVETAFKLGYRHVDTALTYHNQLGVGKALQNSGLPREEYFITSKIPGAFAPRFLFLYFLYSVVLKFVQ